MQTKKRFQALFRTQCYLLNRFISFSGHAVLYNTRPCSYLSIDRVSCHCINAFDGPSSVWVRVAATRINELIALFSSLAPSD